MGESLLRFGPAGLAGATGEAALALSEPGEYRVDAGPNGTFMLTRQHEQGRARTQLLMMGELVSRMTVIEIMNLVTSAQWNGELHVNGPRGARVLTIAQGALKHARSEIERERIGELLVHAGLLQRTQLVYLLPQKLVDERFGRLLVRRGLLGEEQLFQELQRQTETIFHAAMLVDSGLYWFVASPAAATAPATTVHLPIQGLLMESVQRIDELALFRERIPHNGLFPAARDHARPEGLDETTAALFALCDGAHSIADLVRSANLGEFATLKALFNLLRSGQVQLRHGPCVDAALVRRLVRQFNDIVRDIFVAIATYGSMEHASRALSTWLAGGHHGQVLGAKVDIDGTLDASEVLAQVEKLASEEPVRELHQALQALAAYALFLASNGLPHHEERSLARDVNHRLNQLRL